MRATTLTSLMLVQFLNYPAIGFLDSSSETKRQFFQWSHTSKLTFRNLDRRKFAVMADH